MRIGAIPAAAAALAFALAGCIDGSEADGACPPTNTTARIESIEGTSLRVQVLSPTYGPAVLHTAEADLHSYAGSMDQCVESKRDLLAPGQEIEVFVDAWMESYPPQAHVDDVVVLG